MTKKFNFRITDHVLLRYMERMLGVDVAGFRKRLHSQLEPAARAGASQIEVSGMVFKFNQGADEVTATTMWASNSPVTWKRPPLSGDDTREAKKIQARKRMAK